MIEHLNAQKRRYERGDRVKHRQRPEWGVGTVTKAEDIASANAAAQRLSVRFPHAGLKTLNTTVADIEMATDPSAGRGSESTANGNGRSRSRAEIIRGEEQQEEHWLAPVAQQKLEQTLQSIPEAASDPFSSMRKRLLATFDLYRFDRSGRGLIDWAVAQTQMEDPLSQYTRHELEEKFDRWTATRDEHLRTLLRDDECTLELVRELAPQAPKGAQQAVQRFIARR